MSRSNIWIPKKNLKKPVYAKPVTVIAVTAGKGGVGKSNIAVNLAVALSLRKQKVMVLDADLGLANIDILLGLTSRYDLSHVVQGKCQLQDIILQGPAGIRVVPAAGTESMAELSAIEHAGIIDAFNDLTETLDFMIIDTAAGISDTVLSFTRSSNEILVVVCDEPTSITDAYTLIKVMHKKYQRTHFHILANMVRTMREGKVLFNNLYRVAEEFLDVQLHYAGAILFDEKMRDAVKKQRSVLEVFPDCNASQNLKTLANTVLRWPRQDVLSGNTSFFLERLMMR